MPNKTGPQGAQGPQGTQGSQGVQGSSAVGTASTLGFMTGSIETQQSITTTGVLTDLATVGPSVTVNIASNNSSALVICAAQAYKSTASGVGMIGFAFSSGSYTSLNSAVARYDNNNTGIGWYALYGTQIVTGLNSGNNIFTMKYYGGEAGWAMSKRRILVIPL